ncbi:MAG: endonuclease/exonuclease/phosphatase family protein [Candidatus Udaeobacter sp.]
MLKTVVCESRLARLSRFPSRRLRTGSIAGTSQVRITTWNLEWFPNGSAREAPQDKQAQRIKAAADVLKELNPDILLLQEVRDYDACNRLAEAIQPGAYTVAICSAFKGGKQQEAIVAKIPAQAARFSKVLGDYRRQSQQIRI